MIGLIRLHLFEIAESYCADWIKKKKLHNMIDIIRATQRMWTRQTSYYRTSGNFRRFYIAKQEQVTIISYHYKQHSLRDTMREYVNVSVIVASLVTSHYW